MKAEKLGERAHALLFGGWIKGALVLRSKQACNLWR